jgi:hypothetical protein
MTHGALMDAVAPWVGWEMFGQRSIGSFKAFYHLLDAALPIALWMFVWLLQYALRSVATRLERAVLVAITLSLLFFAQVTNAVWFQPRALPLLLCLSALMLAFGSRKAVWFFLAGALTVAALLTTSDSGIYCTGASILAIGVFAVGGAYRENLRRELLPWAAGYAFGNLLVILAFGLSEYRAWLDQIVAMSTRWDFVYSYVYPSPLLPSSWATHAWPIVLLAIVLLVFVARMPAYRSGPELRTQGQIHLLLIGISIISFRTGLGRSDHFHIAQGMAYACFGVAFTLWLLVRRTPVRVQFLLLLLWVPLLCVVVLFTTRHSWTRTAGVVADVGSYARTPDARFLSAEQRSAQTQLVNIVKDDECIFVFPNEPAWYYLLQKPPCVRFFFTVHIMGDDYEQEAIRELTAKAPRHILYSSQATYDVDGISNATRLPALDAWIRQQYGPSHSVAGWVMYQRNEPALTLP